MSRSAFTVKAFGVYLLVLGIIVILVPNLLLSTFWMARTSEIWIRVVGVLVFNVGVYYWYAARCEARAFFRASVVTRMFTLAAFIVFSALGLVSPTLILFGAADFAGGVWTHLALRTEPERA